MVVDPGRDAAVELRGGGGPCANLAIMDTPRTLSINVLLAAILAAGGAAAQVDVVELEGPVTIELSLSNPGARSMGFGGAFVARADDATAAFGNPAGLVQLVEPELSAEFRRWSYSTPYTEGGRISGAATGRGLDTVDSLRTAESTAGLTDLSFLSFVYPKERWSLAFYRHQLAHFEALRETQGFFGIGPGFGGTRRFLDERLATRVDVVVLGLAGAYRVGDALSIGLALTRFDGTLELFGEVFAPDDDSVESHFGPNSYLAQRRVLDASIDSQAGGWGLNAGLLWKLSERWNFGWTFRQGIEIDFLAEFRAGPLLDPGIPPGTLVGLQTDSAALPEVIGFGASYQNADGSLTLGFEWDHVGYSVFEDTDDGDELHVGAEYLFLADRGPAFRPLVSLRLGAWLDPDHRFRSDRNDFERAIFRGGEDEIHLAAGVGLAFERFQIDVAADFSDLVDTISLSTIYSF
jgi:long-subunit fatty acid transport protein